QQVCNSHYMAIVKNEYIEREKTTKQPCSSSIEFEKMLEDTDPNLKGFC
ncbi:13446_t:CDS:2, partial [Gigaspora rosea]